MDNQIRSNILYLGIIQNSCDDDLEQNLKPSIEKIREAAHRGATIIETQELFHSPAFQKIKTREISNTPNVSQDQLVPCHAI